jgi:hypothetical protein
VVSCSLAATEGQGVGTGRCRCRGARGGRRRSWRERRAQGGQRHGEVALAWHRTGIGAFAGGPAQTNNAIFLFIQTFSKWIQI